MQINRDATNYTPPSFDALPSGWYPVQMIEGLETPSSTKPNTYYAAVFEVVDGPFKGRKLFSNFNFNNTNEKAVEIAYDHLDQIMSAVGVLKINVMDQLFNKPLMAKVKLVPAVMEDDGESVKYDPKNELKAYKPLETGATLAPGAATESLPDGFTASVASKPKPAAAAAAAVPKASAPKAEAPVKKLVMTDKLPGVTAEQFRAEDPAWTDQALVDAGYAKWEQAGPAVPKTPSTPAVPKASASSPAAESAVETSEAATATSEAGEDDDTPPWLAEQA